MANNIPLATRIIEKVRFMSVVLDSEFEGKRVELLPASRQAQARHKQNDSSQCSVVSQAEPAAKAGSFQ